MRTLSTEQFERLEEAVGELYPDYSGRGMYGATCLGYVTDEGPAKFQMQLAKILAGESPDLEQVEDMVEELGAPSSDSMGLSAIYYYRGIQVEGHARGSRF
jgi:hypothetical protein